MTQPLDRANMAQAADPKTNPVTAIDILLEPDATMLKNAGAANARLRKSFPKGFALDETHQPPGMRVPRTQIVRKAMEFVEQRDNEYLLVKDLATAAGVSERTLRTAFQEYFSVGPVRYLKLRRLHQVQRRLKAADPSNNSVTEIAAEFGVWELGRFAHDYRCLFGELPSETLRHQR